MHNEALHNLYFCPDIIMMIETWKKGYVGHVEHKGVAQNMLAQAVALISIM
jgi:hypothetical protein